MPGDPLSCWRPGVHRPRGLAAALRRHACFRVGPVPAVRDQCKAQACSMAERITCPLVSPREFSVPCRSCARMHPAPMLERSVRPMLEAGKMMVLSVGACCPAAEFDRSWRKRARTKITCRAVHCWGLTRYRFCWNPLHALSMIRAAAA